MNINDRNFIHKCTSCQICASVCPKEAISINLNLDGFYRPYIDKDKCVNCGICKKVCYKFTDVPQYTADDAKHYAAHALDSQVVERTTSGGIADILCQKLIEEGYICVGVEYDYDKNIAVGAVATHREDTLKFRGSKYIQSYSYPVFKELLEMDKNGKYAIFGTPCQIFGLDKYLKCRKRREQFVLIDIYCHGCPSMNVWSKYVKKIQQQSGFKKFDYLNFRSKVRGWGNFNVFALVDGKPVYVSPKVNDNFYTLFFSDAVLNDSCYDCQLRSTLEFCDIRLGDFWGKSYDMNNKGISVVSLASSKGVELFEKIRDNVWCKQHLSSDFLPYQSWGRNYAVNHELRNTLLAQLADANISLNRVINSYWHAMPLSKRIKQLAKNAVLLMPTSVISMIKKLYH